MIKLNVHIHNQSGKEEKSFPLILNLNSHKISDLADLAAKTFTRMAKIEVPIDVLKVFNSEREIFKDFASKLSNCDLSDNSDVFIEYKKKKKE